MLFGVKTIACWSRSSKSTYVGPG